MKYPNNDWETMGLKGMLVLLAGWMCWLATHSCAQTSQELDEMMNAAKRSDARNGTFGIENRDGAPSVVLDIPMAFNNQKVKNAWSDVRQVFEDSGVLMKAPNSLIQIIQAIVRTIYEPIEESAIYSSQSPGHAVATALVVYLTTAAATGYLDDHIDEIADIISGDDDDESHTSSVPEIRASDGAKISVKDAPAGDLNIRAKGPQSEVLIDFSGSGN